MKRILNLFLLIVVILLISGCSSNPINEISYNDLEKKLKNGPAKATNNLTNGLL